MSHVTCNVPHVTCHMSCVTSHIFFPFCFGQSGKTSRWRVCYQHDLPCLVLGLIDFFQNHDSYLRFSSTLYDIARLCNCIKFVVIGWVPLSTRPGMYTTLHYSVVCTLQCTCICITLHYNSPTTLWHCILTLHYGTTLLHYIMALHSYTPLRHCTFTLHYGTTLLHYIMALYFTLTLHYGTAL